MGKFLCGVETVKNFVNAHFHCNVSISNLKQISKMSRLSPLETFLQTPMDTLILSASFHVWANQAKPTIYEIEN